MISNNVETFIIVIIKIREPQLHQIITFTKLKSKTYKRMRRTLFKANNELFQNVIKVPENIYRWHNKNKQTNKQNQNQKNKNKTKTKTKTKKSTKGQHFIKARY